MSAAAEVAIVDDDENQRDIMALRVKQEGFIPRLITKPGGGVFSKVAQLIDAIGDIELVLCDHKLMYGNYADFYGSEVVAALYDIGKPAILITQYTDTPPDNEYIQKYRNKLPTVLSRDQSNDVLFEELFANCANELSGNPPADRKMHRVFVKIDDLYTDVQDPYVIALVSDWRNDKAVFFPLDFIPEGLREEIKVGDYLVANVNTGAQSADALFFADFEQPPEPIDENELRKSLYP